MGEKAPIVMFKWNRATAKQGKAAAGRVAKSKKNTAYEKTELQPDLLSNVLPICVSIKPKREPTEQTVADVEAT